MAYVDLGSLFGKKPKRRAKTTKKKPRKKATKKAKRKRSPRKLVVGVVGCCGPKEDPADYGERTLPARVLYKSAYFKKTSAYVEPLVDEWVILSAKYGVVLPDQRIALYDKMLPRTGDKAWAKRVTAQLLKRYDPETTEFLVLVGDGYLKGVFDKDSVFKYEAVLQNLPKRGIGHYNRWLAEKLRERS